MSWGGIGLPSFWKGEISISGWIGRKCRDASGLGCVTPSKPDKRDNGAQFSEFLSRLSGLAS